MITSSKRIGYIDALRGFTMFLVVFAHVELFSFGIVYDKSLIGSLFITFRMPMFFFISGFIAYKAIEWNKEYYLKMLKKKSIVQIIPTIFFFSLFKIIFQNGNIISFFTNGPGGFWFTIVLFYMFFIYYNIMLISNKKPYLSDILLISISLLGAIVYVGGMKYYNLERYPILCLTNLTRYFEFFALGILCRKYQKTFLKTISNDYTKAFLILSFLSIFIISWQGTIIQHSLIHVFNLEFSLRYLGLFLVFSIFYHYRNLFDTEYRSIKALRFIGRRTLDIYLIHYFLLPDLISYKELLFGNLNSKNFLIELLIILFITLLIITTCLIVSSIIRSSSILGHYLLGAKLPEK